MDAKADSAVADLAIEGNYWTLSIQDLDGIIDRMERRADTFGAQHLGYAERMREAVKLIRALRDELLVANYEANRKGVAVRKLAEG